VIVAIDGPSGAGKSTLSKAVAKHFGFLHVDTGAIYRAVGLYALQHKADTNNITEVEELLASLSIDVRYKNGEQRIYLNNEDVSEDIRTPEVSMAASNVSRHKQVREFLLLLQRSFATERDVVMDGRDIGTVVLPQADIKIFLTASPEERALRRFQELQENDDNITYEDVLHEIIKRDDQDINRDTAPLKQAENAVFVDTTGNTFDESLKKLIKIIEERV
jgi:cytidylate kinase